MSRFWVVSRKQWRLGTIVLVAIMVAAAFWRYESLQAEQRAAQAVPQTTRVIHMVTGEFKTKTDSGQELEVYRFDPGTVYANEGERVELRILGVNGHKHEFEIEGLNVRGTIEKNKETVVTFRAEEGIYRIICLNHADARHGGPMIGYIVID
ncbi:cupredoxin domain-containing protein [Paenibacillus sp. 481]|uniref:cupredoxin domain-containing protein n=1 Tax=Paenibacillus sp. 481 TaxID=2835869 RepID=UPI001E3E5910|nr:cupredoxin domain-containing protein [Paenibacillus sp. 481]UHA74749.1 cupredoxin domain-containing protein [Paenibacillus sp. 481]